MNGSLETILPSVEQVLTWFVVLLMFIIAFFFLEDMTVLDPRDSNNEVQIDAECSYGTHGKQPLLMNGENVARQQHSTLQTSKPIFEHKIIQRWLPQQQKAKIDELRNKINYKTVHTIHRKVNTTNSSPIQNIIDFLQQLLSVLQLRNSWRVIVFSFASVAVSLQWTASDISLPPFLERRFGEDVPIYTVQNIHMMGSMILPPIVGALTADREDFDIILPGLWIMAVSPMVLVLSPTVGGACGWQIVLTIGQVLWSPRQDSWVASLAPTGMEGLFFGVSCSRALLVPLGDYVMGWLNGKYNPNCLDCR